MESENVHTHPPAPMRRKNTTQVISLIVGLALFVLGLAGLLYPAFAGLHLGIVHSLIISTAGGILLYNGIKDNAWNAFLSCLGFGLFFGTYSILGFVLGEPGMPTMGHLRHDQYFLEIIPRFQEFGRADHVLNGVIALVLLGGALDWAKRHSDKSIKQRLTPHFKHRHA